jgi:AcrR family transcriptional regulator
MSVREAIRPGGRSSRVQSAIHAAVLALGADATVADLSIPLIAARAGVTPSTIYRRWGDLTELLADVAVERLRPDADPADTGSFAGDLALWLEQYADEMSSGPGRALIRDVLASTDGERNAGRCCAYTASQIGELVRRAEMRGECVPSLDRVVDHVVAPVMYRILFGSEPISPDYRRALIEGIAVTN